MVVPPPPPLPPPLHPRSIDAPNYVTNSMAYGVGKPFKEIMMSKTVMPKEGLS